MSDFAQSLLSNDPTLKLVAALACGLAAERLTEIVVSSKLTDPVRALIGRMAYPPGKPPSAGSRTMRFLNALLSCGYCFSVWASAPWALALDGVSLVSLADLLVVHGFAGLWHRLFRGIDDALVLLRAGRVHTIDLTVRHLDEDADVRKASGADGEDAE